MLNTDSIVNKRIKVFVYILENNGAGFLNGTGFVVFAYTFLTTRLFSLSLLVSSYCICCLYPHGLHSLLDLEIKLSIYRAKIRTLSQRTEQNISLYCSLVYVLLISRKRLKT